MYKYIMYVMHNVITFELVSFLDYMYTRLKAPSQVHLPSSFTGVACVCDREVGVVGVAEGGKSEV